MLKYVIQLGGRCERKGPEFNGFSLIRVHPSSESSLKVQSPFLYNYEMIYALQF